MSGVPIFETRVGKRTLAEIGYFVPITLGLIGLGLLTVFRTGAGVLIPLVTSGAGCWVTLGVMGALGSPVTITAMLLPSVLLALGCAYVMHILVAVQGISDVEELAPAIARVAGAITLSGVTTAIGFFAIASIDIDAIRALGGFGGVGVLVVLMSSLTLGPAAIRYWPIRGEPRRFHRWVAETAAQRISQYMAKYRRITVMTWLGLLLVSVLGVTRLEVETDGAHWWPIGSPVRDSFEAIRERLSGISPMNVVIQSNEGAEVTDPQVMGRIAALAEYLNDLADVGKAVSVADPIRQLHRGFGGYPGYPVPGDSDLIAQYLLLLSSVEQIRDLISDDYLAANILIRADNNGSRHLLEGGGKGGGVVARGGGARVLGEDYRDHV